MSFRLGSVLRPLLLPSFLAFALVGCGGGSGDPCQVETDCDDGLICCGAARFGDPTRGVCAASCADLRDDASTMDASAEDAMMSLPDSSDDGTLRDGAADGATDGGSSDGSTDSDADTADATIDAALDADIDSSVLDQ